MEYPVVDLDDSHELWQDALGKVNAFRYTERQALLASADGREPLSSNSNSHSSVDLSDIDSFFELEGKGPKLLEFEFDPVTKDPVPYVNKGGRPSFFWWWSHRLTGNAVKRFSSSTGKSFDTGRLTKFLKQLKEHTNPIAYARAQHILRLNDSIREKIAGVTVALDRAELLAQQVSI
jgi:hypothetical protein